MDRDEQIQAEVNELAAHHQILPEEVQVLDMSKLEKQEHNWHHYGLTHICHSSTHPSHTSMSRLPM